MRVTTWKPVIQNRSSVAYTTDNMGLHLNIDVQCPVCEACENHDTYDTELTPWFVKERKNLEWLALIACGEKTCERCGVKSEAPKQNKDNLETALYTFLTSELLEHMVGMSEATERQTTGRTPGPAEREFEYTIYVSGKPVNGIRMTV